VFWQNQPVAAQRQWRTASEKVGMTHVKVKVKFSIEEAMKAQRRVRGIALLFL
jgi:hypothetical protein